MTEFTPQSLSQLDKDRLGQYGKNLDFYNGTQWAEKSRNRQLVFNYAKIAVDKVTSYLMQGLNFACEPLDESDKAEARLAQRRLATSRGNIVIPPNCGVELWDVIQLEDSPANQSAKVYRISGIKLDYRPKKATFHHTITLASR